MISTELFSPVCTFPRKSSLAHENFIVTQNIPESVNFMIKDWVNFLPSEIDRFIISPQDLVQSFQTEEELTWFGLSDKWAVKEEFKDRFPPKSHLQMTPDERKVAL